MVSAQKRGAEIRQFILEHVEKHPVDIVTLTMETFGISRQGVHRHIQTLRKQKAWAYAARHASAATGCVRSPRCRFCLTSTVPWRRIASGAAISVLCLVTSQQNVLTIWQHGFTEIMNNAIVHSAGHEVFVKDRQNRYRDTDGDQG